MQKVTFLGWGEKALSLFSQDLGPLSLRSPWVSSGLCGGGAPPSSPTKEICHWGGACPWRGFCVPPTLKEQQLGHGHPPQGSVHLSSHPRWPGSLSAIPVLRVSKAPALGLQCTWSLPWVYLRVRDGCVHVHSLFSESLTEHLPLYQAGCAQCLPGVSLFTQP